MPIFDSKSKYVFGEGKPLKFCHWPHCPLGQSEAAFAHRKMRVCGKCTVVRYCSRECQEQHWPFHKARCRAPACRVPYFSPQDYEWLFKWAILEGMEVNTNPTKILDHCMIVKVMQRDRILDPNEPQNFLIESASVAKIVDTYARLFPDSKSAVEHITRDIANSVNIRNSGGTGQGLALFVCGSSMGRQEAPRDIVVLRRYALTDPLVPAGHRNMHEWPGIVKGVANAIFSYEDVLRAISGDLPRFESEESGSDEDSEGTWAESDTEDESE